MEDHEVDLRAGYCLDIVASGGRVCRIGNRRDVGCLDLRAGHCARIRDDLQRAGVVLCALDIVLAVLLEAARLLAVSAGELLDGRVEAALRHSLDGCKALQDFFGFVAVHIFDGAQ